MRTPGTRRTRLAPQARRDQLIQLGLELLTEQAADSSVALAELSVDELATRAGISRGLLFHYFTSKQDYLRAVVTAACEHLIACTQPPADLGPTEQLRACLRAYVDYALDRRTQYTALVRGSLGDDPEIGRIVDAARRQITDLLVADLPTLGIPEHPLRTVAVRAWIAFAEETVVRWPQNGPDVDRARLVAFLERGFHAVLACLGEQTGPAACSTADAGRGPRLSP